MDNIKKKQEILVTVGIPSYNRSLTLARTIESIINQSYTNIEILISDDCSPDVEVDKVIQSYRNTDPRIIYLKQEKNIGPRKNHALLIHKASGEYFMWLSDDDYISENYIEEIMNEYSLDNEYSLIGGHVYFINTTKGTKIRKKDCNLLSENPTERFLMYLDTMETNSIYHSLFRRKDGLNYNMDFYGTDWLHVARLAFKGKIKTLPNISMYREDSGGESNRRVGYFEYVRIYYNIYIQFKYDLFNSDLYKRLTDSELLNLNSKVRRSFLKYLYVHTFIGKLLQIMQNIRHS